MQALSHHGFEVFVYSMVGRKNDYLSLRPSSVQAWSDGIEEHVRRRPLSFLTQYGSYGLALPPLWITAYLRAAAASPNEMLLPALLRAKLRWCDAVVADFPFVHPIFTAPSARARLRVLSTHNVEHHMYDETGRWRSRWIRERVRRIEHGAARACDILVTCCESDKEYFEAQSRVGRSIVVPNGIDLRRFRGIEGAREPTRRTLTVADDVRVFLFTASRWGPNAEAFDYLAAFAKDNRRLLVEQRIHILVVGNVVARPVRLPGFTATGMVDEVEPYFAASDAALNPITSGTGTNVKMGEFLGMRLPLVTTRFGARGFRVEDGRTGFVFERESLAPVLSMVRRLFDEDPGRLQRMAADAYTHNENLIDMDAGVRELAVAMRGEQARA